MRQYLSLSYIKGQENKAEMLIFQDIISTKVKVEEIPKPLIDRSVPFLSTVEVLLDTDELILVVN